ncbi:NAD-dependent epimerase/dehydratase family protein [Chelativorans xinjiangense]|uniref:NAD-dependent epimerase/dehydratase family protein n=1 Tax=Chelativorans xinjiangense TaxID=2681485 RepID=UPI00135C976E|nr:NAD(P)-dependent oxidoreductase [Chelativorans xinjiangense]
MITGGAGFVGSHLACACLKEGHEVHAVVREPSRGDRLRRFERDIVLHRFDLRSDLELKWCIRDVAPQVVYHLAASLRRPEDMQFTDVTDCLSEDVQILVNLLSAAANSRVPPSAVVRTGSLAEYGLAPRPYREDMREEPITVYGAGLVAATHLVGALQRRLPFLVATARLALVYGPAQSTEYFVPWLIQRCLAGARSIVRRPDDRRDLIHVDDAVSALIQMGTVSLPKAAVINIATGVAPSMREVARQIIEITGADPGLVKYGAGNPLHGAPDLRGTPDLARQFLGWSARVPLAEGISRLVAWHRDSTACASYLERPSSAREHNSMGAG